MRLIHTAFVARYSTLSPKLESPPDGRLLEALCAKPWLFADGQPFKPQDVLALPPTVDEAARALLLKGGETPPFLPVAKLVIDVRKHPGFDHLEKWVLPDQRSSFDALALMVEDVGIIGRLGAANDYPIERFRRHWPTTAAILGCRAGLCWRQFWPHLKLVATTP